MGGGRTAYSSNAKVRVGHGLIVCALLYCATFFSIAPLQGQSLPSRTTEISTDTQPCVITSLEATGIPLAMPGGCFSEDEVWLVDGRTSHINPDELGLLQAYRQSGCQWIGDSIETLWASHQLEPNKVTFIYVHGDRTDEFHAVSRGMEFYQNVFGTCRQNRPSVRFVIWAWKSEKEFNRPSRDFTTKSSRSRMVGKSLANFLDQFSDRRLVMAGYSLGCQAFLIALEELSAKEWRLVDSATGYHVGLIAPALEPYYVSDHRCRIAGSELVAKSDIFYNSTDRALRCARFFGARQVSGGGASIDQLAWYGSLPLSNISMFDFSNSVGKKHSIKYYSSEPIIGLRLREMVTEIASMSPTVPASQENHRESQTLRSEMNPTQ